MPVPNIQPNATLPEIIRALQDIVAAVRELERQMLLLRNVNDIESFGE